MGYAESPPPAELASWVHCVWTFADDAPATMDRVVPDGRPELIAHLDAPFSERAADGAWHPQPRVLFAGQVTRPLHLRANGPASVIGVRFRPAGARAFFGASMRQATDRRIGLDIPVANVEEALALVRERVGEAMPDATIEHCAARIEASRGNVTIDELVEDSGVGRRQLERRFGDAVGIGPALLAAIFRFRTAFDVIERDGARPWTDAALDAGYFDQSHFIRDFRRFVGCTPTEFARTSAGLSAALVE